MMLADHDFDIDAEVARKAEDFNDAPDAVVAAFGKFEHFGIDDHSVQVFDRVDLAWLGADTIGRRGDLRQFHAVGNFNPLLDTLIGRDHIVAALLDAELANHCYMGALEDADDFTLRPALIRNAGDVDQGAIAVHKLRALARRQEDIALDVGDGFVGNEETKAVAMNGDAAGNVFGIVADGDEVAGAQFDQGAFIAETVERLFELIAVLAGEAEFFDQLFVGTAGVRKLAQMFQECGVTEGFGRLAFAFTH